MSLCRDILTVFAGTCRQLWFGLKQESRDTNGQGLGRFVEKPRVIVEHSLLESRHFFEPSANHADMRLAVRGAGLEDSGWILFCHGLSSFGFRPEAAFEVDVGNWQRHATGWLPGGTTA